MKTEAKSSWVTRQLSKDDPIPYELLLLADETIEAINKYSFDSDIYVIEQADKVIASYVLYSLDKDEIEIKNIAVNKAFRGRGIGTFLLEDAAIKAKGKKYKAILIGTADTAIKQLHLYQKAGFELFEIKKGFFTNNYPEPIIEDGIQLQDMVMLRKTIK